MTEDFGSALPLRSSVGRTASRACVIVGFAAGAWLAGSTWANADPGIPASSLSGHTNTITATVKTVTAPVIEPAATVVQVAAPKAIAPKVIAPAPVVAPEPKRATDPVKVVAVVKAVAVDAVEPVDAVTEAPAPAVRTVTHTVTDVSAPVVRTAAPVVHKATHTVTDVSAPVVRTVVAAAAPVVRTPAPVVHTVTHTVTDVSAPVVRTTIVEPVVRPAAPAVKSILKPIVKVAAPVVEVVTKPLVAPVVKIANAVKPVLAAARPVVRIATSAVAPLTATVKPLTQPLVPILDTVREALGSVVGILDPAGDSIAPVVTPATHLLTLVVASGLSVAAPGLSRLGAQVLHLVSQTNPAAVELTVPARAVPSTRSPRPSPAVAGTRSNSAVRSSVSYLAATSLSRAASATPSVPSVRPVSNSRVAGSRADAHQAAGAIHADLAVRPMSPRGPVADITPEAFRASAHVASPSMAVGVAGPSPADSPAPGAPGAPVAGAGSGIGSSGGGSPQMLALAPTADFTRQTLLAALSSSDDARYGTLADRPTFSPD
jgi:hypothetical protein